jgi:hypothetical protein
LFSIVSKGAVSKGCFLMMSGEELSAGKYTECEESVLGVLGLVRVSPSHTLVWVQTDSDQRYLKNILIVISSWTTSDPSWEASDW